MIRKVSLAALMLAAGIVSASAQTYYSEQDSYGPYWRSYSNGPDTGTSAANDGTGMSTGPDSSVGLGNTDTTGSQVPLGSSKYRDEYGRWGRSYDE